MAEDYEGAGVAGGEVEQALPQSKRDKVGARLRAKYPDKQWDDDEAMWGQVDEDYGVMEEELGSYRDREDKLMSMMERDPKSARFLTDMAKGQDPWIGVLERLGIDGVMDLLNNPEKREEYAQANAKYMEDVAKDKKYKEEFEANLEKSMAVIDALQEKDGVEEEQMDAAWKLVQKIADEAVSGVYTEETMRMALKAVGYDAAVAKAGASGEVRGKNAKIEAQLRKPQRSDGTARLGGMPGDASGRKRGKSMFERVKDAQI
ncbi:MAG: hypothetical protein LIO91_08840 [Bacteroidales bacterium]|nr:hypothetical protein [Bacteroidales bacterium]